jgi:hypothetical protein
MKIREEGGERRMRMREMEGWWKEEKEEGQGADEVRYGERQGRKEGGEKMEEGIWGGGG